MGAIVAPLSWPGLARPPTTGGADRGKDVDGRHKAGHDTGGAGPAKLAPTRTSPTMAERQRDRPPIPSLSACFTQVDATPARAVRHSVRGTGAAARAPSASRC